MPLHSDFVAATAAERNFAWDIYKKLKILHSILLNIKPKKVYFCTQAVGFYCVCEEKDRIEIDLKVFVWFWRFGSAFKEAMSDRLFCTKFESILSTAEYFISALHSPEAASRSTFVPHYW